MTHVVERTYTRELDAGRAAVLWNYWDHEHLVVVHSNYTDAKIIYENDFMAALLLTYRLPVFSFLKSHSLNVMIQHSPDVIKAVNVGLFGVPVLTTIRIEEDRHDHCRITMNYRFFLMGWKRILAPLLSFMIPKWNEQVWQEDLPLKLRRHKMLRLGFKDFYGLPSNIADRVFDDELTFTKLPLSRLKEVNVNALKKFTFED
ncbi:MAG: hypothetical protein G01um1014106_512 [Parcubacteria group bacterium Gr01-1014_106]|nr:MAG: hypothetical protein G01um1014106_512 [Parcubacteria group bacterium Gr01-1014_106]